VGSKFLLQFVIVSLIEFLAIVEFGQCVKQSGLPIVTLWDCFDERWVSPSVAIAATSLLLSALTAPIC
jgi:hypothetical protein